MSGVMLRVCPDSSNCPPFEPIGNFSSEADDGLDFVVTRWNPDDTPPPLLQPWTATNCGFTCVSQLSQLDAEQCASAGAILCIHTDHGTPNFLNNPQTCCVACPDGISQTCYTIPGGIIVGLNQESADQQAHQLACNLVKAHPLCINNIKGCGCINVAYAATLSANRLVIWSLIGGSLPPGITLDAGLSLHATISGVPTVNGQYNFEIKALDPGTGVYTTKIFSISVIEITTTQLSAYSIGTPYSFQLQAAGGSGNYLWKIKSGTLPPGLTMNNSGLISGTPT